MGSASNSYQPMSGADLVSLSLGQNPVFVCVYIYIYIYIYIYVCTVFVVISYHN